MKFISANTFLKVDEKVRNSIMDWWRPEIGDLAVSKKGEDDYYYNIIVLSYTTALDSIKKLAIPLLTVGQLIEYLEYKTGGVEITITCANSKETLLDTLWQEVLKLG